MAILIHVILGQNPAFIENDIGTSISKATDS